MGMSRSASLVIYYMMRRRKMTYDDAYQKLKVLRPLVNPNSWYKTQLTDIQKFGI
jgi:protein-tyrosine phosphatase